MFRYINQSFLLATILLLLSASLPAQTDIPGCKDHPLFNRMPNTYIIECSQNFNEMEIQTAEESLTKKEGMKTSIMYAYDYDKPGTAPSFFQIVKNYENAMARYGGKKLFFQAGTSATFYMKANQKEIWVVLEDQSSTQGDGNFIIHILEIEAMRQEIQASALLDSLNKNGHIALYINFETSKSDIRPESQKIIKEVASMLSENKMLKVSIEGHTDNVGYASSNQNLSSNRASAVMAAIANKGIDKTRLSAKGWGQDKPIASNSTDAGRAQNRRVEIVKQ
jgi:OOP family OmpA-OmpF porin